MLSFCVLNVRNGAQSLSVCQREVGRIANAAAKEELKSDPAKKADLQMKELANGRLAMFAFGGFVTQSVLTGNTFPYLFDYQTAGDIVAIAAQGASP